MQFQYSVGLNVEFKFNLKVTDFLLFNTKRRDDTTGKISMLLCYMQSYAYLCIKEKIHPTYCFLWSRQFGQPGQHIFPPPDVCVLYLFLYLLTEKMSMFTHFPG